MLSTLVCALGGCTLSPFDDDGLARKTTQTLKLSPSATQPAEFVQQSRPEKLEYVPVGVTPPARTPLKDPKAMEKELQSIKDQAQARATAPRPSSPYDGKIEPGFKPPPPPPLPPSAASPITVPQAQPGPAASPRDRVLAGARRRANEAAKSVAPAEKTE